MWPLCSSPDWGDLGSLISTLPPLPPLFESLSLQELMPGRAPSVVLKVYSTDSMLVAPKLARHLWLDFINFAQL